MQVKQKRYDPYYDLFSNLFFFIIRAEQSVKFACLRKFLGNFPFIKINR